MAKATITMPTHEEMRVRFKQLQAEIEAIEKKTAPMRAKYDKFVNESDAKAKSMAAEYLKIEEPLVALKNEFGTIARALGGRTGDPAETEAA
jgi:hypothetical protein